MGDRPTRTIPAREPSSMRPTRTPSPRWTTFALLSALATRAAAGPTPPEDALEARLGSEDPAALALDARRAGDPSRGAVLFFRPSLQCAQCHAADGPQPPLGPDLARLGRAVTGAEVVESVLNPSKTVRKGYEPVTIATHDGTTYTGLLAEERPDGVVVRDPSRGGARPCSSRAPRSRRGATADPR